MNRPHIKKHKTKRKWRTIFSIIQAAAAAATVVALLISLCNNRLTNENLKLSQKAYQNEYEERIAISGYLVFSEGKILQLWPDGKGDTCATTIQAVTKFVATNNSRSSVSINSVEYTLLNALNDPVKEADRIEYGRNWIRRGISTSRIPLRLEPSSSVSINDTLGIVIPAKITNSDFALLGNFWRDSPIHQVLSWLLLSNASVRKINDSLIFRMTLKTSTNHFFPHDYNLTGIGGGTDEKDGIKR
jgi:hypothetical protein